MILAISLKTFLKGSFWVSLATVITRLAGFITLPFLARTLDPSGLGIYNLIFNVISTADNLSRMGIDAAMSRNGAQYENIGTESVGRLFGVGSCLMIGIGTMIAISTGLFGNELAINWLGEPKIKPWMGIVAISIFLTEIGIPSWFFLLALQEFRLYSLRMSILTIVSSMTTVILAYRFGLTGAIWSLAFTGFLQLVLGLGLTLPVLDKYKIKLRFDRFIPESISILKFGLPFYAANFLGSFVALPLLGYVSKSGGIEQIGYLRVAQSLSQFVSFLPAAIAPVLVSSLSASLVGDSKDHQRLKSLHLRILWSVILFTSLAISFNLDWIVGLLFGASYQQAIILSRLTIWITAISSLAGMLSQYVLSLGNTRAIAIIQTTSLILMVLIAMILIPQYNSLGLLIAQGVSVFFTLIAYVKPALADMDTSEHKYLWLLTFESATLFVLSFLPSIIRSSTFINVTLSLVFLVMGLTLTLSGCFTAQERLSAYSLLKNLIAKIKTR